MWSSSTRGQRYLEGEGMDPAFVLIMFGNARFSSSSPGFGSGPVRWFRYTLETCEFRTSITCSACLRPTWHARMPVSGYELEEQPVGQRRVLNKNVQVHIMPPQLIPRLPCGEDHPDCGSKPARPHRPAQASAVPAMSSHVKALA